MRKLRYLIRNFFGFNRSQTNAFLVLLPLMALFLFSRPLFRYGVGYSEDFSASDQIKFDSLIAFWETDTLRQGHDSIQHEPKQLFFFNPNQATISELQDLGFNATLSHRIINYREKGGKFLVKSDLFKIYSMDSMVYSRVYSFIQLPDKRERENYVLTDRKSSEKLSRKLYAKIDLNTADSVQLKKIFGIGEKLSARIIKYRERLGGFIELGQLSEIYGLDTTVIKRLAERFFIENSFAPRAININAADARHLATHPYINKQTAEAIVAYRFQHGNFKSLQDLRRIQKLDTLTFQKILPYVKLNE